MAISIPHSTTDLDAPSDGGGSPGPIPHRSGPLTHRETEALFHRWQQLQDRSARDVLVERFLPLARKLARRYNVGHEPFDDLMQVASLGLVKAVDRFDCSRGNAFSSFAVPTILGELKRYFRDHGWAVHVPRGAQERAVKVDDAQQQLSVRSGRAPTVHELAEFLELSIEEVLESLETARAHHATSLDAPHDDGEGESTSLVETFGDEDPGLQLADARVTVAAVAKQLSDREREVLALRFVDDLTQTQIAEMIGVSQMQVSRILRRSIGRLAELSNAEPPGP
jgi:RNA polymerase sigma-B factor